MRRLFASICAATPSFALVASVRVLPGPAAPNTTGGDLPRHDGLQHPHGAALDRRRLGFQDLESVGPFDSPTPLTVANAACPSAVSK